MRPLFAALSILCLAACDVPYPNDSWEPEYDADDDSDDEDDDQGDDDDFGEPETSTKDAAVPRPDTGPRRNDGGMAPRNDGGSEPSSGIARLAGRYAMRIDLYSTASSEGPPALRVKNRISALLLADLVAEGDELVANETLCDLVFDHRCDNANCVSFTTRVSAGTRGYFGADFRPATRTYTLGSGNELRGGMSTLALGMNEGEGQSALPSSVSDPRVWKVSGGGGIYAEVAVTAKTAVIPARTVTCQVSSVQRLKTAFAKALPELAPDALAGITFSAETSGSENKLLLIGPPGTRNCTEDNFNPAGGMAGPATVRLKPYEGESCPAASYWQSDFAASPPFM